MHPRRHDSRRPRRRDRHDGPRGREVRGDSNFDRERSEREFVDEMHGRFQQFLASDEQGMALEPMNSFKRRVVHNLAKEYGIETESRGEDRERHVYLARTTSSATPAQAPRHEPGETGASQGYGDDDEADTDESSAEPSSNGGPSRSRGGHSRERSPEEPVSRSTGRVWDFGSQTFPVNPGANGVHIAVKRDGSIEIFQERDRNHVVAERLVTSKQFRVRKGKIVQPGEPGW